MKIVKMQGGLGNQMFQYAFAKSLETYGHNVLLDTSLYTKSLTRGGINYTHNGFELDRLFSIDIQEASLKQIKKLATLPTNIISRFKRKYLTKKTHIIDKNFKYSDSFFSNPNDAYLEGYWQTEKYFLPIQDEIRQIFSFTHETSIKTKELIEQCKQKNIASIHVRRGDYAASNIHAVCSETYYNNAIKHALEHTNIDAFFVFSNDLQWAKENINFMGISTIFVDWNTGINSWQDMYLMSLCKINIIANSSFSWWAAWLNNNTNKKIIAPTKWSRREIDVIDTYYTYDYSDIVPSSWERISI